MVTKMKFARSMLWARLGRSVAAITLALAALACAGSVEPTATPVPPTPTPQPDPAALLAETAGNLLNLQSVQFVVRHEVGAIFVPAFGAKVTEASGAWDRQQGAELAVDAYVVTDPQAEAESGIYMQFKAVITPDAYYATEPLSGGWIKQPLDQMPLPANDLNRILADLLQTVAEPVLAGQENFDGAIAYRISGRVPAAAMEWLMLEAEEGQSVEIDVLIDKERKLMLKLRIAGPVGPFDQPDTVREILLTNIDGAVEVEPPKIFLDLSGG